MLTGCSQNFGGLPYYTFWAGRRPYTLSGSRYLAGSSGDMSCVAGVISLVAKFALIAVNLFPVYAFVDIVAAASSFVTLF